MGSNYRLFLSPLTIALIVAAVFAASWIAPSTAHKGASGVIKMRMDSMKTMAAANKEIAAMLIGKKPFEPKRIARLARRVAAHGAKIEAHFPVGSNQPPSEARREIWTQWREFKALAARLRHESLKLAASTQTSDKANILARFRMVGRVCSKCHDRFRIKRQ